MNATKNRSTNIILVVPGQPLTFDMYDAALTMSAQTTRLVEEEACPPPCLPAGRVRRGSAPCNAIRIDYVCVKRIPPLLDVQKN